MTRAHRRLVCGAGLVLGACASTTGLGPPSVDGPRLQTLEIRPASVLSGCPFAVAFTFADPHGDVLGARATWIHETDGRRHDSGLVLLPVDRAALVGRQAGKATAVLTVQHPGRYWYSVQIEDAAGRKSNVLEEWVVVYRQPASAPKPCDPPG